MMKELLKTISKWQKTARKRREDGVFIIEGIKMYEEIPKDRILHTVVSQSFLNSHKDLQDKSWVIVTDSDFEKISDTKTPQGILAVLSQFEYTLSDLLSNENPLLVLLEDIQDPGNLGTILRSAEASGATGIIMTENTVDIYNSKVIRSTMGSFLRVPFIVTKDLHETMKELQKKKVSLYAAHLEESSDYDLVDYKNPTGFLIGNESKGLKKETADLSDKYIKIPMKGQVESLNAAMAATILMFEAARQRR